MSEPIEKPKVGVGTTAMAGDVIACRYCKLRLTLDEVKTWVGCDACNDGEDWLKAAIHSAKSPTALNSATGSAQSQKPTENQTT